MKTYFLIFTTVIKTLALRINFQVDRMKLNVNDESPKNCLKRRKVIVSRKAKYLLSRCVYFSNETVCTLPCIITRVEPGGKTAPLRRRFRNHFRRKGQVRSCDEHLVCPSAPHSTTDIIAMNEIDNYDPFVELYLSLES